MIWNKDGLPQRSEIERQNDRSISRSRALAGLDIRLEERAFETKRVTS